MNSTLFYCQNILIGQWYLDKVKFSNGSDVEVNNPMYSMYSSLRFDNIKVYNSPSFDDGLVIIADYKLNGKRLNFTSRDFEVERNGKYLLLNSSKENLNYYYLKGEDFPDSTVAKQSFEIVDKDSIAIRSIRFDPYFNNLEENFDDYLRKNIPDYEFGNRRVAFSSSFIITKNNKIKDIKITSGKNKIFDREYIAALQKSEKYWKNETGKDVIMTRNINHRTFGDGRINENKALNLSYIAGEFYNKNDFKNAIINYLKSDEFWEKDREEGNLQEENNSHGNYLKLGICYLIENERAKACEYFNKNGGISDFSSRNYVLNFCTKP